MTEEPTPPVAGRLAYQPALDGIRAIAVLAVIAYHGGLDEARAGFIGVDMFLVLSGFLITTLLLAELRTRGRIAFGDFWIRRARRLLPALVLVLVAVAVYGRWWARPAEQAGLGGDLFGSLFYVQNWRLIAEGQSYFDQFSAPSPLRHMWSLAIEEQWYLVWPLALAGIVRLVGTGTRRLTATILAMAAVSAVAMWWFADRGDDLSRAYYGTDTRAQALLAGAALAVVLLAHPIDAVRRGRGAIHVAGIAGLAFVGWVVVARSDQWSFLYRGGFSLVAVATVAVIAAALLPGPLRSVLGCPPLPQIGLISYGLYLWHWPVDVVMSPERTGLGGGALFVARSAVAVVIALASYVLLERPIRERRWRWTAGRGRIAWYPIAVAATAGILAAATVGWVGDARSSANPTRPDDEAIARFAAAMTAPPAPGVTRVLVEGDSIAASLAYRGFERDWSDTIWLRGSPRIGCGLFGGRPRSDGVPGADQTECGRWASQFRTDTKVYDPDLAVLLLGGWEVFDRDLDGQRLRVGTPEMETALTRQLARAQRILTDRGARLVLLTTPCFSPTRRELGQWGEAERSDPARVDWLNRVWRRYAAAHPEVTLLDLHDAVCPGGRYVGELDGRALRTDGVHFTDAGSRQVWQWLAPSLHQLTKG